MEIFSEIPKHQEEMKENFHLEFFQGCDFYLCF